MPLKLYILSYWGFGIFKRQLLAFREDKIAFCFKMLQYFKMFNIYIQNILPVNSNIEFIHSFLVNPLNKVWMFSQQNVNSKYSINFILS